MSSWLHHLLEALGGAPAPVRVAFGTALLALTLQRLLRWGAAGSVAQAAPTAAGAAGADGRLSTGAAQAGPTTFGSLPRRLSLSTAGVLLEGGSAGVTPPLRLVAGAKEALAVLLTGGAGEGVPVELHLITRLALQPGVSEAAQADELSAFLASEGVVGEGRGRLPAHRSLVCSTHVGRVALVRQLAADLHVEACADTVAELSRFGIRLQQLANSASAGPGELSRWLTATWPLLFPAADGASDKS